MADTESKQHQMDHVTLTQFILQVSRISYSKKIPTFYVGSLILKT